MSSYIIIPLKRFQLPPLFYTQSIVRNSYNRRRPFCDKPFHRFSLCVYPISKHQTIFSNMHVKFYSFDLKKPNKHGIETKIQFSKKTDRPVKLKDTAGITTTLPEDLHVDISRRRFHHEERRKTRRRRDAGKGLSRKFRQVSHKFNPFGGT